MLTPAGPHAALLSSFLWITFAIAGAVSLLVLALLVVALLRRRSGLLDVTAISPTAERRATRGVAVAAIATTVILASYFGVSLFVTNAASALPGDLLEVDVTAHQWWWEFHVQDAVTANELHIPVGRWVRLRMRSADVIHSFWVPQLAPKADIFPHEDRTLVLEADRAGRYEGVCAEFCGVQHAWMRIVIIAEPADQFARWVSEQAAPRLPSLVGSDGERIFQQAVCASCHTIRGTTAQGQVGPDLTHLATRTTIGAGVLPFSHDDLAKWIRDPQLYKPGSWMPVTDLTAPQWLSLVDYLEQLR